MARRYDDEPEASRTISKFIPAIVFFGTLGGFIALSWYAYHAGHQSMKEEDLLVVEAEKTPMKEKPLDPGGMKFPNQDKTIFETFSNNTAQPKGEHVQPTPEEPITKSEALEAMIGKKPKPEIIFNDDVDTEDSTHAIAAKTESVQASDINPEIKKEEKPKAAEKPVVEKPSAATPAKTSEKSGGEKVQLGAFGSEKEAMENWAKIQKKSSSLAGKSPIIVKADVKGKGTFYRLRVGGFADKKEAKALCSALSGKGQACILVGE